MRHSHVRKIDIDMNPKPIALFVDAPENKHRALHVTIIGILIVKAIDHHQTNAHNGIREGCIPLILIK